jgi:ABC-2 type transport system permease protein
MLPTLVRKTLRDDRRAFIGWAVGLAIFIAVYVGFYPQFKNDLVQAKMAALPEAMKQFMGMHDVATAAGYLEMTVYTLTGPLLLIMAAVVLGTRAVATPEENHTLELMLANPISRRRFVLERLAALVTQVVLLALVAGGLMLVLAALFHMAIPVGNLISTSVALMLLALLFGTLALAAGAITGRRSVALATAGGAAVAAYVIHGLSNQVSSLSALKWLSPFQYYIGTDPLRTGFHATAVLVPLVLMAVFVLAAIAGFQRRDLAS